MALCTHSLRVEHEERRLDYVLHVRAHEAQPRGISVLGLACGYQPAVSTKRQVLHRVDVPARARAHVCVCARARACVCVCARARACARVVLCARARAHTQFLAAGTTASKQSAASHVLHPHRVVGPRARRGPSGRVGSTGEARRVLEVVVVLMFVQW